MQPVHGLLPLALRGQGQDLEAGLDGLQDARPVLGSGASQPVAGDLRGMAGVADAQSEPAKVAVIALAANDVSQAVVPAVPTAELEPGRARSQVQLVVDHQHFGGWNAVEPAQGGRGLSASVHVGGGDEQANLAVAQADLCAGPTKPALGAQRLMTGAGRLGDRPGADIVPGVLVLGAGIAQADDDRDCLQCRASRRDAYSSSAPSSSLSAASSAAASASASSRASSAALMRGSTTLTRVSS